MSHSRCTSRGKRQQHTSEGVRQLIASDPLNVQHSKTFMYIQLQRSRCHQCHRSVMSCPAPAHLAANPHSSSLTCVQHALEQPRHLSNDLSILRSKCADAYDQGDTDSVS